MKRFLSVVAVVSFLAISSIFLGCEKEGDDAEGLYDGTYQNYVTEGATAVFGQWYKNAEGSSGGWSWYWANIYLEQSGTNVWGLYRWEQYGSFYVEGSIVGNKLYLKTSSNGALEGTVSGDSFECQNSMDVYTGTVDGEQAFSRISADIPSSYW